MNVDIEKVVAKGVAQVRQGAPEYDLAKAEAVIRQWVGEIVERYPDVSGVMLRDAVIGRLADWLRGRAELRRTPPTPAPAPGEVGDLIVVNRSLTGFNETAPGIPKWW